jgi:Arc/MetJ family transcription regulator
LVVALKRLRQRFRELVDDELAETVCAAEDLERERAALHAALRDRA